MESDQNSRRFESVFSHKVRAGKRRTYFFDVRKTKGEDYYITLTESTKRFNGDGYERHKIFLYKEDFNRFVDGLEETIQHVKTELMPDYDYDEFTRRNQEWEEKRKNELSAVEQEVETTSDAEPSTENVVEEPTEADAAEDPVATDDVSPSAETEEDMSW